MATLDANNRVTWMIEKGLRHSAECPSCKSWAIFEYPTWDCYSCGSALEYTPSNPEAEADYLTWDADYQASLKPWSTPRKPGGSSGEGEWANGYDMFMLPHDGDPERRTAYSLRDFEQKARRTNLNEDGVTTWDKQPPRFLTPDEKSPW